VAPQSIFRALHSAENVLQKEMKMGDVGAGMVGLAAVVLSLGIPMAAMYTYFRVKKLRSEERLAALARGTAIPFETEVSPVARSRKAGILMVSGAIGYIATFGAIAVITHEPDTWAAAAFGFIPLAIGIGYFIDFTLSRREAHS
jgi:hypothetical protein